MSDETKFVQSGPMPWQNNLRTRTVLDERHVAGWNEAMEVAACKAETWGNAPPNPHGRRAALAQAIRDMKIDLSTAAEHMAAPHKEK